MKRKGTDSSEGSSCGKKGKKKSPKKNDANEVIASKSSSSVASSKSSSSVDFKPLKGKRKRGSSNNGSGRVDEFYGLKEDPEQIEKKRRLNEEKRSWSESPSDLQPLQQYVKNGDPEEHSTKSHIKTKISGTKKQKKGKKNVPAEKEDVSAFDNGVENIQLKAGVLKNANLKNNKIVINTDVPENASPVKKIKKKVRIDETESLKYKKEMAESEHHFTKKELPAKIIKSKLNKNLTEEVKVNNKTKRIISPVSDTSEDPYAMAIKKGLPAKIKKPRVDKNILTEEDEVNSKKKGKQLVKSPSVHDTSLEVVASSHSGSIEGSVIIITSGDSVSSIYGPTFPEKKLKKNVQLSPSESDDMTLKIHRKARPKSWCMSSSEEEKSSSSVKTEDSQGSFVEEELQDQGCQPLGVRDTFTLENLMAIKEAEQLKQSESKKNAEKDVSPFDPLKPGVFKNANAKNTESEHHAKNVHLSPSESEDMTFQIHRKTRRPKSWNEALQHIHISNVKTVSEDSQGSFVGEELQNQGCQPLKVQDTTAEQKLKQQQSESKKNGAVIMPKEDQLLLVQRIQESIPEGDTKSYNYRLQNIVWSKVTFKQYSVEDCQKVWGLLFKKVRHYRLLSEITSDVKQAIEIYDMQELQTRKSKKKPRKHPDMPKRPRSSYLLYFSKKKDKVRKEHPHLETQIELSKFVSEMYQTLPPEKKLKYEMLAAKHREEYNVKLEEFYTLHPELRKVSIKKEPKGRKEKPPKRPDNPYRLFMQSELERDEISEEDKSEFKEVCREKWRQMTDAKKLEWINLAEVQLVKYEEATKEYMARHPDYTPKNLSRKPFLSREELHLKEKLAGKPKKPPTSAYSLFVSLTIQSNDAQEIPARERWAYTSAKWKEMTEAEKNDYKVLLTQVTEQYQKDFKSYLDSLPEDKRQEEILKNLPKRKEIKKKRTLSSTSAVASAAPPSASGASCSGLGQFDLDDRDQPSTSRGGRPKGAASKSSGPSKGSKTKQKVAYPVHPPRSAYKFFSEKHKGPSPKEAWKNLSCKERRQYKLELDVIKDKYIQDFEAYLKSLDRDELSVFCANRNTQEEEYSSSDPSESESEDEEESSSEDEAGNLSSDED